MCLQHYNHIINITYVLKIIYYLLQNSINMLISELMLVNDLITKCEGT
jgi:hypothetical protein